MGKKPVPIANVDADFLSKITVSGSASKEFGGIYHDGGPLVVRIGPIEGKFVHFPASNRMKEGAKAMVAQPTGEWVDRIEDIRKAVFAAFQAKGLLKDVAYGDFTLGMGVAHRNTEDAYPLFSAKINLEGIDVETSKIVSLKAASEAPEGAPTPLLNKDDIVNKAASKASFPMTLDVCFYGVNNMTQKTPATGAKITDMLLNDMHDGGCESAFDDVIVAKRAALKRDRDDCRAEEAEEEPKRVALAEIDANAFL